MQPIWYKRTGTPNIKPWLIEAARLLPARRCAALVVMRNAGGGHFGSCGALRQPAFMDKKSVDFHVQQDDYFGSLATVLDLLRQDIERQGYKRSHALLLEGLRDELLYLQTHCKIVRQNRTRKSGNKRQGR